MDLCVTEMHKLHQKILSMDADRRYTLQPKLNLLIARTRVSGGRVPSDIAQLNNALLDEAIEAQFDNLPV
ncbi:MAG: hypothetical protein AAF678_06110 [Pseudomonadota bacterium]